MVMVSVVAVVAEVVVVFDGMQQAAWWSIGQSGSARMLVGAGAGAGAEEARGAKSSITAAAVTAAAAEVVGKRIVARVDACFRDPSSRADGSLYCSRAVASRILAGAVSLCPVVTPPGHFVLRTPTSVTSSSTVAGKRLLQASMRLPYLLDCVTQDGNSDFAKPFPVGNRSWIGTGSRGLLHRPLTGFSKLSRLSLSTVIQAARAQLLLCALQWPHRASKFPRLSHAIELIRLTRPCQVRSIDILITRL